MSDFQYPKTSGIDGPKSVHEEALRLRTRRFELMASNIANADTPNYKARDIDFSSALERAVGARQPFSGMTTTTRGHIASLPRVPDDEPIMYKRPAQTSIDGNTVEMDRERVEFAENALRMQFSLQEAIGDYKSKLELFRNMTP